MSSITRDTETLRERIVAQLGSRELAGKVEYLGHLEHADLLKEMRGAGLQIFPSEWYETFGRGVIEAFACGVPVIAARLGAAAELVDEGRTGLLFEPGDARSLAEKVAWSLDHEAETRAMGREARTEFERRYTARTNYETLAQIYARAIELGRQRRDGAGHPAAREPA